MDVVAGIGPFCLRPNTLAARKKATPRNGAPGPIGADELRAVVQYRDRNKENHADRRAQVYQLLAQHVPEWLGGEYELADPPESLLAIDHAFDAWLSALTAFAHTEGMTITWQDAGINEEQVNVDGHILILKPHSPAPVAATS